MKFHLFMTTIFTLIVSIFLSCGDTVKSSPDTTNAPQAIEKNAAQTTDNSQAPTVTTTSDPLKGGPAEITLNVKNMTEPTASLIGFFAENHFKADTATVNNGKIVFKRPGGYDQGLYYVSIGAERFAQIILGEDQKFDVSLDANDPLNTITVNGSLENELFYENLKYEQSYNARYSVATNKLKSLTRGTPEYQKADDEKRALENERRKKLETVFNKNPNLLFTKFKMAGQNPTVRTELSDKEQVYHFRQEFWDNVDFSDTRLIRTPVINNKLKRYIKELTPQNADSIVASAKFLIDKTLQYPEYYKFFSNWIVLEYEAGKSTLMDPEAVFVNITQEYFTKERAFWADSMEVYAIINRSREMGNSLVGQQGPNVSVPGVDGVKKTLYDSKADYIVVYLYAPSCEHCMEETPKLVQWYNENKGKGCDVYAIALDTEIQEWKDYIAKNNMTFTNVHDPTNVSIYSTYYVDVTPELYLLNKERKIIGKNLKTFQLETMMNKDKEKLKG